MTRAVAHKGRRQGGGRGQTLTRNLNELWKRKQSPMHTHARLTYEDTDTRTHDARRTHAHAHMQTHIPVPHAAPCRHIPAKLFVASALFGAAIGAQGRWSRLLLGSPGLPQQPLAKAGLAAGARRIVVLMLY